MTCSLRSQLHNYRELIISDVGLFLLGLYAAGLSNLLFFFIIHFSQELLPLMDIWTFCERSSLAPLQLDERINAAAGALILKA